VREELKVVRVVVKMNVKGKRGRGKQKGDGWIRLKMV